MLRALVPAIFLILISALSSANADDAADCEARNEKSVAACTRLIERGPETPKLADAYYNRGMNYRDADKYDAAIKDFSHAMRLRPDWIWPLVARGHAYAWSKRYDEAIADQELAVKLDPSATTYNGRAMDLMDAGESDRALRDFNKALELNPKYFYALRNRADLFLKMKRHREALADYQKALEIGSNLEAENRHVRDGIKKVKALLGE